MREFSVTAYRRLAERVDVPLLVAETSDGAHMNAARLHRRRLRRATSGPARSYKGGITGAMRIAHLADSFQLRAEVHGGGLVNAHLCMAIPNTTYYESLVYANPIVARAGRRRGRPGARSDRTRHRLRMTRFCPRSVRTEGRQQWTGQQSGAAV